MTFLKWRKGNPYIYKSVRDGQKVTSVYMGSYAKHLRKGGEYFPIAKEMTAAQIKTMQTIEQNVRTYLELLAQNQKASFKPYQTGALRVRVPERKPQRGETYFIRAENGLIKIGTSTNTNVRINGMQTGSPVKLTLVPTPKCADSEYDLHKRFAHLRVSGEWFNPDDELNNYIESISK